jgi:uncharacterized protein YraI
MQTRITMMMAAVTAVAALSLPSFAASAATVASAVTPLNIRSGPGPQYNVIGAIPTNGRATVSGCIQGSQWCQISFNGTQGWAYSQYLIGAAGPVVVSQTPPVTYAAPPATVGSAVVEPTISGEFIAPAGAPPLSLAPPPPTVQTYVTSHPVQQVYVNGEVVEGAGLPQTVVLNPVPQSQYEYAYVNGVPVLVEPKTRRVTYIYR